MPEHSSSLSWQDQSRINIKSLGLIKRIWAYNDEDKNNAALDIDLLSGDIEPVSNLFWFKLIDLTYCSNFTCIYRTTTRSQYEIIIQWILNHRITNWMRNWNLNKARWIFNSVFSLPLYVPDPFLANILI